VSLSLSKNRFLKWLQIKKVFYLFFTLTFVTIFLDQSASFLYGLAMAATFLYSKTTCFKINTRSGAIFSANFDGLKLLM
jgi:hypothetical protein